MRRTLLALTAICLIFTPAALARAQTRVEVGTLTCTVAGGAGFIFGSSKNLRCTYAPFGQAPQETYSGKVRKFGIDLGFTGKAVIAWAVLAPSAALAPGSLAGKYVGVSADAAALVGGGAKVLVGGSNDTIALQPISVQAQTGLNIAVGIAQIELVSVEPAPDLQVEVVPSGCGTRIILAPGDTLASVARRCGTTVKAILAVNPSIRDVRSIPVGKVIVMPTGAHRDAWAPVTRQERVPVARQKRVPVTRQKRVPVTRPARPAAPTPPPSARVGCGGRTVVGAGETLDRVAQRCGVSLASLIAANPGLRGPADVKPGITVIVPPTRP